MRFLEAGDRVLVLGPSVGDAGAAWIRKELFKKNPLIFGAKILPWREFVRGLAREEAVRRGEGFREFQKATQREYLRKLLSYLSQSGVFHHLQDLWQEEKFFSGLLDTITELRKAGLGRGEDLERARAALAAGDSVYRNSYEDLWHLLLAWDQLVPTLGQGRHDEASLLSLASAAERMPGEVFLLGFTTASLLETELIQALARAGTVSIPLFASPEEMEGIRKGREPGSRESLIFLQSLLTAFGGGVEVVAFSESTVLKERPLLEAHTPLMEARAAGALIRVAREKNEGGRWRVVIPSGHWQSPQVERAFFEQVEFLGAVSRRSPLDSGVGRWIVQALKVGPENYSLETVSDFARLLSFTKGPRFSVVPTWAMKSGIRRGLSDWVEKLPQGEVSSEFLEILRKSTFPSRATPADFEAAMNEFFAVSGIARIALDLSDARAEHEAHTVIASFFRNAAMLAASSDTPMDFSEWLNELEILLGSTAFERASTLPEWLSFHEVGEWLPPDQGAHTLVLGMNSGAEPSIPFSFYLEEDARRRLSQWLLRSRVVDETGFHRWCEAVSVCQGEVYFSRPRNSMRGGEEIATWVMRALPMLPGEWPDVPTHTGLEARPAQREFFASERPVERVSASLVSTARRCLFKAYIQKIASVEDASAAPEIDVPKLQEGSLLHLSLKKFYEVKQGHRSPEVSERARILLQCVREAAAETRLEYYKGSEQLLELQVQAMHRRLSRFVESDVKWLAEFPLFQETLCEVPVEGELASGIPYQGSVDRIDRDPENQRFLISDYKLSTTPSSSEVRETKDLQLLFYMDAMERAWPGWKAAGATYINLRSLDRKQGLVRKEFNRTKKSVGPTYYEFAAAAKAPVSEEDFQQIRDRAREEVIRLAGEMKRGNFLIFPLDPKDCERCGVRSVCRIREMEQPESPQPPDWGTVRTKLVSLLSATTFEKPKEKKSLPFSDEQSAVLERGSGFVFVEASAGTGKTTVIVERFRRAVHSFVAGESISPQRAVEKIRAISFTEKSARELAERVTRTLLPEFGADVAARAVQGISTIHGFCRQVLQDFPLEAGVHPMFTVLDEVQSREVKRQVLEEFFLEPDEIEREALSLLLVEFSRAAVEKAIDDYLGRRVLLEADMELLLRKENSSLLVPRGETGDLALRFLGVFKAVAKRYDAAKEKIPALDFNDLERFTLVALRNPKVSDWYRSRIGLLMVDEFQDTNALQREIVDLVALPDRRNLFVVGDAKQSIYRFRAADVSVFQGLKKEAEKAGCLFPLSKNFRSQAHVVGFANHIGGKVFPGNGEFKEDFEADFQFSEPHHPPGTKVAVVAYENSNDQKTRTEIEPDLLVKVIRDQQAQGRRLDEIAVIFRRMAGNSGYLKALSRARIPYVLGSSAGFWVQPLVVDGVALLRAVYNDRNDLALLTVLRSPWCRWDSEKIDELLRRPGRSLWQKLGTDCPVWLRELRESVKGSSPARLLTEAWKNHPERIQIRERLQWEMLVDVTEELEVFPFGAVVDTLSESVAWGASEDDAAKGAEVPEPSLEGAVKVLTVHASKGLEFPVVILPDLDGTPKGDTSVVRFHPGQGISLKTEAQRETKNEDPTYAEIYQRQKSRDGAENARLFYVAVTRAEKQLILLLEKKDFKKPERRYDGSWGSWIRMHGLGDHAEWKTELCEWENPTPQESACSPPPVLHIKSLPPSSMSISELAAFRYCEEFHRRKFVQAWDDRVVDAWPKPPNHFARIRKNKKNDEVSLLLRKLGLERKDRGIALHRVLERVQGEVDEAEVWLRDAYENQGANPKSPHLTHLIRLDMEVLESFLQSEIGRRLFGAGIKAWPEVPFIWKTGDVELYGAMDRLVELAPGHWVVVDYKSSVTDDNIDRYRFQVNAYRRAIEEWKRGEPNLRVEGWLVDLSSAEVFPIPEGFEIGEAVSSAANNYTLPREKHDPVSRGVVGGEKCFVCPYALHCAPGRDSVLKS